MLPEFEEFQKIARLSRDIVVSEKIDGTNASIYIGEDGSFGTGSRNRWITPEDDNFGFSRWAHENRDELMQLGPGWHYGEWWGSGIQRRYGQDRKRFSLFNASRWADERPACCDVVPVLYSGPFDMSAIITCLDSLVAAGSRAAPGFMDPEGIIVYHTASRALFKKTIKKDDEPKSKAA